MVQLQRISPVWDAPCIVAATGPSLTEGVVRLVRYLRIASKWRVMAVQDAYKAMPWADAMYGSCPSWWRLHKDCAGFNGKKWASHEIGPAHLNDNSEAADKWNVSLVAGQDGSGFSFEQDHIHYGSNSGFQAINLALLLGCKRIVLVGFDMRLVSGRSHFFGDHPQPLHQNKDEHYRAYIKHYDRAAKKLPSDVSIINATPGSALQCFPMMSFEDATSAIWRNDLRDRDRAVALAG